MCFGCSKEPSHWDGSFEYPQHMFWMINKENNFPIRTLIWRPGVCNENLIFLFLNQNICCGYSKEPSQWDSSFEHPKHMFKLMGMEIFTILRWIFCLSKPMSNAIYRIITILPNLPPFMCTSNRLYLLGVNIRMSGRNFSTRTSTTSFVVAELATRIHFVTTLWSSSWK